jgi:hypothetical protein
VAVAGQQRRHALLERLFELVHADGEAVRAQILSCEKGQKLLADLLPLWPPPRQHAILLALVQVASPSPCCPLPAHTHLPLTARTHPAGAFDRPGRRHSNCLTSCAA